MDPPDIEQRGRNGNEQVNGETAQQQGDAEISKSNENTEISEQAPEEDLETVLLKPNTDVRPKVKDC